MQKLSFGRIISFVCLLQMRVAIIDLGTNTFHLLAVEIQEDHSTRLIHRERFFVRIAKESFQNFTESAIQRAFEALDSIWQICQTHNIQRIVGVATEAFRVARNGTFFLEKVREKYGFETKLVSGDEEAELIYLGVKQRLNIGEKPQLIMDIGGGSVEFVVCTSDAVIWEKSFQVGVSILRSMFAHENPILIEEEEAIKRFFEIQLSDLIPIFNQYHFNKIIGTAGSFDAISQYFDSKNINVNDFLQYAETIKKTSINERIMIPSIGKNRAELMVLAIVLIEWILEKSNAVELCYCDYALKEGALLKYFTHDAANY